MSDFAYLDDENNVVAIDLDSFCTRLEKFSSREAARSWARVGQDKWNDYRVSTVFLGMDHGFGGPSLWFETMVFKGDSYSDLYCERYATWDEAKTGHDATLEKLKNGTLEMYGEP